MKKIVWSIAVLACGFSAGSFAQDKLEFSGKCTLPAKPEIVNGSTASEAEMIDSQKKMKEYLALGNEFLTCLDGESSQITAATPKEEADAFKAKIDTTHNAVVDDMNAVAELFNAALRAYKSKNQ